MKGNSGKYISFVLMGIIAGIGVTPAFAVEPPSDTVTITVGNNVFTCVFYEADEVSAASGATIVHPIGGFNTCKDAAGAPLTNLPPASIFGSFVLTEPGTQQISDIFISQPSPSDFCPTNLCFVSDDDQGSAHVLFLQLLHTYPPILGTFTETGLPQDVPNLFGNFPITISIQSDLEPNPSIPEFPIPFSLVIIFVAVAAVYMGIRQKMIPGFKRF